MAKPTIFTRLRQFLLFYVLLMVATSAWLARERTTDWNDTLWVAVYPINGDGSVISDHYINQLQVDDFAPVEEFFSTQIARHGLALEKPIRIDLRDPLTEQPPALPAQSSILGVMYWSLKMRYWAWRMERSQDSVTPDIKMFMVYFDPEETTTLAHSVGLQKGLFGVVNAFAGVRQRGSNQVVLSHELMHTVGASDKYDPATALPIFPHGYADASASPQWPQDKAEIMGGRIPISATEAVIPRSLKSVVVGDVTAREIKWRD